MPCSTRCGLRGSRWSSRSTELRASFPGVDLAAYRVVQEALTNALKYGGTAHAWVELHWRDGELELEVANDGRGDGAGSGGGHGLAGMREHVALYGGEHRFGPEGRRRLRRAGAAAGSAVMSTLPAGLVSFLMTDIEGSTKLLRRLGKGPYEELLQAHRAILSNAVEEFSGHMVDTQGDSTFAVFDRPSNAIRAAAAAQRALDASEWPGGVPPRVRMGVHTGESMPSDDTYHGLAVHRTARICAAATGGQVLMSDSTVSVLEDTHEDLADLRLAVVGERGLKDFEEPVRLHQIVAAGDGPFVARGRLGVLVVDDQALVRAGFRMILEASATSRSWARPGTAPRRSRRPTAPGPT